MKQSHPLLYLFLNVSNAIRSSLSFVSSLWTFSTSSLWEQVFVLIQTCNPQPSLLTELQIQLGYPAPWKGKPVDELLTKVREWQDWSRGVVVALDKFDQLDSKGDVVYDLPLVNGEAESPISLLMISNRQPSTLNLDPRSSSRLNYQTLQFKPYNTADPKQILEHRVEQAFRPGTVPDEVFEEISRQLRLRLTF